jgi:Zn-dependent peptidase ImmA (M78 family)
MSDVSIEEARGFSIGRYPLPVIAINGAEPPRGKLFTLLHEVAHILLHRSALCDLEDAATPAVEPEGRRLEWYCNSVAAAALMPRNAVLEAVADREEAPETSWSNDDLRALAGRFGDSAEAMLVRLVTLNLASREEYRARRPVFSWNSTGRSGARTRGS